MKCSIIDALAAITIALIACALFIGHPWNILRCTAEFALQSIDAGLRIRNLPQFGALLPYFRAVETHLPVTFFDKSGRGFAIAVK